MSEMIERVARAVSQSFHDEGYIEGVSDPAEWNEFLKAARAAIEAMREPTDRMVWDGGTALHDKGEDTAGIWAAMIDAALGGKP